MSTIKDLNIRLQIRKYAINNEWGKFCPFYTCERELFSQFTKHCIGTEETMYAFSPLFEFF